MVWPDDDRPTDRFLYSLSLVKGSSLWAVINLEILIILFITSGPNAKKGWPEKCKDKCFSFFYSHSSCQNDKKPEMDFYKIYRRVIRIFKDTCAKVELVEVSATPAGFIHNKDLILNFFTAKLLLFWWRTFFGSLILTPNPGGLELVALSGMWWGMFGWMDNWATTGRWGLRFLVSDDISQTNTQINEHSKELANYLNWTDTETIKPFVCYVERKISLTTNSRN